MTPNKPTTYHKNEFYFGDLIYIYELFIYGLVIVGYLTSFIGISVLLNEVLFV